MCVFHVFSNEIKSKLSRVSRRVHAPGFSMTFTTVALICRVQVALDTPEMFIHGRHGFLIARPTATREIQPGYLPNFYFILRYTVAWQRSGNALKAPLRERGMPDIREQDKSFLAETVMEKHSVASAVIVILPPAARWCCQRGCMSRVQRYAKENNNPYRRKVRSRLYAVRGK